MNPTPVKKLSTFQIIISGFLGAILAGALILMLPISSSSGEWTPFSDALFTSTSAICVTGLIVHDTATYWSNFGQAAILVMIQIGGLGIVSVAAFLSIVSGRRIGLLQRNLLQDSISAPQIGGIVRLTRFIFRMAFLTELAGALVMLPTFLKAFGKAGIWKAFFHSISAFCNAGFDVMGDVSGEYSSLTYFAGSPAIVIPVCMLILTGGFGFLTWDDVLTHRFEFKKYRMQSKAIFTTNAVLIAVPAVLLFFTDYSGQPAAERFCLSLFQAITPRTAGFNTADLSALSGACRTIMIILMFIGGSPGSTAGGMKTTTVAVLYANVRSVIKRRKSVQMFGRRVEDETVRSAAALLMIYMLLAFGGAVAISISEQLPIKDCIFETASAIGTVGLTLGITPSLGTFPRVILIVLMFFGRVGGLTLLYAALSNTGAEVSQSPVEKISVG